MNNNNTHTNNTQSVVREGCSKEVIVTKINKSVQVIINSEVSTSQKIRDLAKKGVTRGEIAKLLGIRYQFVRNVLEREIAKNSKVQTKE
jgi:DNA invertase Pin-like site-specific DNA recombinase